MTLTANVFPTTGSGETGTVTFFDNGIRSARARSRTVRPRSPCSTLAGRRRPHHGRLLGDANFIGSATTARGPRELPNGADAATR